MTDIRTAEPEVPAVEEPRAELFRALPLQFVETGGGVVLKRGLSILEIRGNGAPEVMSSLLELAEMPRTREELRGAFPPRDHAAVDDLIDKLLDRRMLVPCDGAAEPVAAESGLDVFYWNFGTDQEFVAERLAAARLTVVGVNEVSRSLVSALAAGGFDDYAVVDYHLLRNISLFDEATAERAIGWNESLAEPVPYRQWSEQLTDDEPRFIVLTSDFGPTPALRRWNRFCVDNGWGLLPVVLHDLVGYIGPMIAPGETACYECLRARQNSHLEDPVSHRAPETRAYEDQRLAGFHPSMARIVGELAAVELLKFHGRLPMWRVGTLIEINLMAPSLTARTVLKVPRCPVCSPLQVRSTPTLNTRVYNLSHGE